MRRVARSEEGSSGCWNGLVPRPLISCDFILTEMTSLTQIEITKSEVEGSETSLDQDFKLPSES